MIGSISSSMLTLVIFAAFIRPACAQTCEWTAIALSPNGKQIAVSGPGAIRQFSDGQWHWIHDIEALGHSRLAATPTDVMYATNGELLSMHGGGVWRHTSAGPQIVIRNASVDAILSARNGQVLAQGHTSSSADLPTILMGNRPLAKDEATTETLLRPADGTNRWQTSGVTSKGIRLVFGTTSCSSHHDVDCSEIEAAWLRPSMQVEVEGRYVSDNDIDEAGHRISLYVPADFAVVGPDWLHVVSQGEDGINIYAWRVGQLPVSVVHREVGEQHAYSSLLAPIRSPGQQDAVVRINRDVYRLAGPKAMKIATVPPGKSKLAYANGRLVRLADTGITLFEAGRWRAIASACHEGGSTR